MLQLNRIVFFVLSLLGFASNFLWAQGAPDKSLVAGFSFIKGSPESYPKGFTAKILGASLIEDRFGNEQSAIYLHGSPGSYINLGTSKKLKPTNGTVAVWFKIDNTVMSGRGAPFNPIVLTKSQQGDDFFEGYSIAFDFNSRRFGCATTFSELNQVSIRAADTAVYKKWYHLAITYDDNFLCLYVNGVLENKMPKNFTSKFLASDSVMIGNSANYKNERYLNGAIDDIEIYNRALSPQEIMQLYNAPNPNKFAIYKELIIYALIVVILLFAVFKFAVWNYKRKTAAKQAKMELDNRILELETKSIRTQMNPHFVFNSLNTLNRFILEADLANAEIYLVNFSRLLRKLMESSNTDRISLAEEIDILKDYVVIEKMRFSNSFEFEISCSVSKIDEVFIPFMLIQPFVENAIWHGLMPKTGKRLLTIAFSQLDHVRILCVVEDNGVGREAALQNKDPLKKKSLALDFIGQRLELITRSKGINCYFNITDKKDIELNSLGTKVEIIIPIVN